MMRFSTTIWACALLSFLAGGVQAEWFWIEGEDAESSRVNRHGWYDDVKKELFSGSDWISNFDSEEAGEASYTFEVSDGGEYDLWVRANPLSAALSYELNEGGSVAIDLRGEKRDEVNVAADGKPDLRFLAWSKAGKVPLKRGTNHIRFQMSSENHFHGYLDCFVFTNEPFRPEGTLKPDEIEGERARRANQEQGWFGFDPAPDSFESEALLDLRHLNEEVAGESGFITAKEGRFYTGAGEPVRFWGVNGPPRELVDRKQLREAARALAKRGVNLMRWHGPVFDDDGEVDPQKVQRVIAVVEEMKTAGIYTHLSIYFPLWLKPRADHPWLKGYNGDQHPFASLYFNEVFQAKYREWWRVLLTTPSEVTGHKLIDEAGVFGAEAVNEDSFFFWTFKEEDLPQEQWRLLEKQFGDWVLAKYESLPKALEAWDDQRMEGDAIEEGRIAIRPLWNIFNEKKERDKDTAAFLLHTQTQFYQDTHSHLRELGFKGLIHASNWTTASPTVLGPLEKLSYTVGDFVDRHGYFGSNHQGDNASWSIRNEHTYRDRSALRFDAEDPAGGRQFVNSVMDPQYDAKPSMISETTFTRPNRYRSEAPLYYATYGALQDSDAIVHFAYDGMRWEVKPGFWMQPWTLMSPAMMGQFPAAASIYRRGLIDTGDVLADVQLSKSSLLQLEGTPLPQDAALDEFRLRDVPQGGEVEAGERIDPLVHYAGRVTVKFTEGQGTVTLKDLKPWIDHNQRTVTSTNSQVRLDYGKGLLYLNSPLAQGVSGALSEAGRIQLKDIIIESELELGNITVVSMDGRPIAESEKIFLQVTSEEKNSGFTTSDESDSVKRITNIGHDPWQVRDLQGVVQFQRNDAATLEVTALDGNGYPIETIGTAEAIRLLPQTLYYWITP